LQQEVEADTGGAALELSAFAAVERTPAMSRATVHVVASRYNVAILAMIDRGQDGDVASSASPDTGRALSAYRAVLIS
jgi:hypothetical protein